MKRCSAFKHKKDDQSYAPESIVSLQRLDGTVWKISRSEINSGLTRVDQWKYSPWVLSEKFIKSCLTEEITTAALMEAGISRKIVLQSWNVYSSKFGDQMAQLHRKALSSKLKNNKNGARDLTAILPKEELIDLVAQGLSVDKIAKKYRVSWHTAQRNVQRIGLSSSPWASSQVHSITEDQLKKLAVFNDHIVDAWKKRGTSRMEFVRELHRCFLSLALALHWVKDLGHKAYNSSWKKGGKKIPSLCWSLNYHELILSLALEEAGIAYARQLTICPKICVDFGLINTNVVVEVDGPYHQKEDDMKRDQRLSSMGLVVVRVSLHDVEHELETVMAKINTAMMSSPQLGRLEFEESGTFKLRKTTLT